MFTVVVLHIIFIWPGNIVVDHGFIIFKLPFLFKYYLCKYNFVKFVKK